MKRNISDWLKNSSLFGENAAYIESLYDLYCVDPNNVSSKWQSYFAQINQRALKDTTIDGFTEKKHALKNPLNQSNFILSTSDEYANRKQSAVLRLINAYRVRGHQFASLNPIAERSLLTIDDLEPASYDLNYNDLDTVFDTGSLSGADRLPLKDILTIIRRSYTENIGCEYMHITDTVQKRWIQQRIETTRPVPSKTTKISILERLIAAESLEKYLHNKYVGQKRFSLEGAEVLIPALDQLLNHAGINGIKEMVIGMAHRGRLNVLINILGKSPTDLFNEFEGNIPQDQEHIAAGDVKYHKGYASDIYTPGGNLHLVLAFNPSHLEIVSPVVHGSVRARQQRYADRHAKQVMPVIIHGDSAFAGQGVVMETLQMSQSRGFTTGGTVHIIINNQIGFTTSNALDTRSTLYCTDVAKMVQAPIFHVNGDDPEAVVFVTQLAMSYRQQFHKDVVIDIVCYRRHGHNEADEPACTQPMMYKKIREHISVTSSYAQSLTQQKISSATTIESMEQAYLDTLESGQVVSKNIIVNQKELLQSEKSKYIVDWQPYFHQQWQQDIDTTIAVQKLRHLAEKLQRLPESFALHPRVEKIIEDRKKMAVGALSFNWGGAEILAYASILDQGFEIRLSGQDAGRGTFFHRHSVLHNQKNGKRYIPLQNIAPDQPNFLVIDSLLSEEAVLAYEYGYASAAPKSLVIWEAQFGDFANGAQVVIDQFISSGEEKWQRLCGLVMFLPHGYEGQGAEHSSARLERYLQLCADNNMQVCIPSTPAQLFHLLRRQVLRPYRKPLITIMPKSLLRHKKSISTLEELCQGQFNTVINDEDYTDNKNLKRIILCTGKVYFDLIAKREALQKDNVAIIRIEQLYPFPLQQLTDLLNNYSQVSEIFWCQEEPKNQGAWTYCQRHIPKAFTHPLTLSYVGRKYSAAPAVGSFKLHIQQQEEFLEKAFKDL